MPRKLDLRSGRPVWFAYRAPAVPNEYLKRDVKTDVLIVGMGISGAMMAEALTAVGHSVICIDRRGPLIGSTSATTALVQFEIDQPITKLSKMIGKSQAQQAWRRSRLAVTNLKGRIAALDIRCSPSPVDLCIWLATSLAHCSSVQRLTRAAKPALLQPTSPHKSSRMISKSIGLAPFSAMITLRLTPKVDRRSSPSCIATQGASLRAGRGYSH